MDAEAMTSDEDIYATAEHLARLKAEGKDEKQAAREVFGCEVGEYVMGLFRDVYEGARQPPWWNKVER